MNTAAYDRHPIVSLLRLSIIVPYTLSHAHPLSFFIKR